MVDARCSNLIYSKDDLDAFSESKGSAGSSTIVVFPCKTFVSQQMNTARNMNGFYPEIRAIFPRSLPIYRDAVFNLLSNGLCSIQRIDRMLCPSTEYNFMTNSLYSGNSGISSALCFVHFF